MDEQSVKNDFLEKMIQAHYDTYMGINVSLPTVEIKITGKELRMKIIFSKKGEIKWAKGSKSFINELIGLCYLFAKVQALYLVSLSVGYGFGDKFKASRFYVRKRG